MAILKPAPYYRTDSFTWVKETKTFSACASDLRWAIGFPKLGRVYDDACDEGFTLVSSKTGDEMVMVMNHTEEDRDYSGGWRTMEFVPALRRDRDMFRVVVFND